MFCIGEEVEFGCYFRELCCVCFFVGDLLRLFECVW
jgi:hypothetical protein